MLAATVVTIHVLELLVRHQQQVVEQIVVIVAQEVAEELVAVLLLVGVIMAVIKHVKVRASMVAPQVPIRRENALIANHRATNIVKKLVMHNAHHALHA